MVSLKKKGSSLSNPTEQLDLLNASVSFIPSFASQVNSTCGGSLKADKVEILQINVGYVCNQVCEHCHVDAGPDRKEIMTKEVLNNCLNAIDNSSITTVDITGGAPEMNPHFKWFVTELSKRSLKIIVRSNLTILVANKKYSTYPEFFKENGVEVVASLPCYTEANTDKQRGNGVFQSSIKALLKLNELGYGKTGTSLVLNLVFNPGGASLPPEQSALESDYKKRLKADFNIEFNQLFTITNLPVSRFLDYLLVSNRYEGYMQTLANSYNAATVEGLMCRNTISVSWDGYLYDCDFNQMLELKIAGTKTPKHIRGFSVKKVEDRNIVVGQHCYGCTAGAGSSCQGSLT